MKIRMLLSLMVLFAAMTAPALAGPPEVPATPAPVDAVLLTQPFTLDEPYEYKWQAGNIMVKQGLLLVIDVDPDLVIPRQTPEPVLFVGNATAERVNSGYPSGKVVAIVPGTVDLSTAPIWFGEPMLPEQVTAAIATSQRARADEAGIGPISATVLDAALDSGGSVLKLADYDALRRRAAELIQQYAAGEEDLAMGILAPKVGE